MLVSLFEIVVQIQSTCRILEREQSNEKPEMVAQETTHIYLRLCIMEIQSQLGKVLINHPLFVTRRNLPFRFDLEFVRVLCCQFVKQVSNIEPYIVQP
jgi:hypothetical protein